MGLRRPRPGPEHHDNSRPPTAPPVCLEADLFPAGLESAKGVTCSPPARLALSRPAVRWGRVGESGGGGQPSNTCQTVYTFFLPQGQPLPTSLQPQPWCPHPPVAPVWCTVTSCPCLIHGWGLGAASQEREEFPWGIAQFLPAHRAHGCGPPASCLGLGLEVKATDGPEGHCPSQGMATIC